MAKTLHHLRTSERHSFKRCQARWWWAYREGLKGRQEDLKLWFGTGIHLALAQYYGNTGYKRNMDYIDLWNAYSADSDGDNFRIDDNEYMEVAELGRAMLVGYHEHYGGDPDWDVIAVEETFQIEIPHWLTDAERKAMGFKDTQTHFQYDGTWDGVYRDKVTKRIRLMEHKTAASISDRHLTLDDQAGSYWAVAQLVLRDRGILKKGQSIEGIHYNFLRKGAPDIRPINAEGYRTNKPKKEHYLQALTDAKVTGAYTSMSMTKLAELAEEYEIVVLGEMSLNQPPVLFERFMIKRTKTEQKTQFTRIRQEELQMDLVRDGIIPPVKNPTRDCSWDCEFFNLCELDERGSDTAEFKRTVFRTQDPYGDHRKPASAT